MHRDKKIGFALGILLLGIVAAFFFRNEPDPFAELPPLDDPESLDAQIAEKPIAPYTEPADGQTAPHVSPAQKNPWELPEIYRANPAPPIGSEGLAVLPGAPAPINLAEPIPIPEEKSPRTIEVGNPFGGGPSKPTPHRDVPLRGNEAWTSVPSATAPTLPPQPNVLKTSQPAADLPVAKPTMYTIQQGDTLSLLAEKHLGSSRRFMEIYEANRDKLKNPDDIKMGLLIRIPPRVKFSESLPPNTSPIVRDKSPIMLPPPEEANRFSPFSRSPLSPVRRE